MVKEELDARLAEFGQSHLLRFWDALDDVAQSELAAQIESIDLPLMKRLTEEWIFSEPEAEAFSEIQPVSTIPQVDTTNADAGDALAAGEEALRDGRVGLLLVAGGQGTRLGFDGPKGAYPIGPLSKDSLFAAHANKIHNLQDRYKCTLPWYIMVSDTNKAASEAFFAEHNHFGLQPDQIFFFTQRMVPCVDGDGKFFLEAKGRIAMNPNGHGGTYLAMQDNGMLADARNRGVDTLSYFQVDNWAARVADPYFIGYHLLGDGEMSSKIHRKREVREAVGVHVLCDGEHRTIEYSELDIYPQLLETDADGNVVCDAGNPAIHILDVGFIERICDHFDEFPWHRAHKKIPYIDESGNAVQPDAPNGYKFETFIFDALRFAKHAPIALEIPGPGEYTPIKQFDGDNSVQAARKTMREYWAKWLEEAGFKVPRDGTGAVAIDIEINPQFALTKEEFLAKVGDLPDSGKGGVSIGANGTA
jgi:UDP-N-acetylglucosamine/UDP-N-acetylgalactosamine diphosphorylase